MTQTDESSLLVFCNTEQSRRGADAESRTLAGVVAVNQVMARLTEAKGSLWPQIYVCIAAGRIKLP